LPDLLDVFAARCDGRIRRGRRTVREYPPYGEVVVGTSYLSLIPTIPTDSKGAVDVATSRAFNLAVLQRGGSVRVVFSADVDRHPDLADLAAWMSANGAQVRVATEIPMRLLVVDEALALILLDPRDPDAGTLAVDTPGLVAALHALARRTWEDSVPWGGTPLDVNGARAEADLVLLGLLSRGLTDEAMARRLGVSERTVARRLSDLLRRLGARSRFEAGAIAVRRGLL
jgi:DNA-binding CsgD family transcriptional regulator